MHLQLEAYGQRIAKDLVHNVQTGERCLTCWDGLEARGLLIRFQRMNPGHQDRTTSRELMLYELLFHPVVVFLGSDDALDLIGRAQMLDVAP